MFKVSKNNFFIERYIERFYSAIKNLSKQRSVERFAYNFKKYPDNFEKGIRKENFI